ncbi:tRNA (adenosine(37)-N6)-threonylcarbamoyltransferase complex dimerization subunit type 1 TsaB [Oscillospiraceae bacterium HV4-5-C5C]|nr:tRNA (adenosine(37)-N6)-threonylcarbamoyltransferase complex dimerization subunit type 1 TsaB [Oscillospiraceae bacterium HV4-5-C5C]
MKILAIDTSGAACCVALADDSGQVLVDFNLNLGRTHSQQLQPLIGAALKQADWQPADLQAIAVGIGPGSYTGIRIGAAAAQGMAVALDIPVLPVSSLASLAASQSGETDRLICPLTDARHRRVYAALWWQDRPVVTDFLGDLQLLPEKIRAWLSLQNKEKAAADQCCPGEILLLGSGAAAYESDADLLQDFRSLGLKPQFRTKQTVVRAADLAAEAFRQLRQAGPDCLIDPARLRPHYLSRTSAERQAGLYV